MCGARYLYVEEMTSTTVQAKTDPCAKCVGLVHPWSHEQQLRAWELFPASLPVHPSYYCVYNLDAGQDELLRWEGSQLGGILQGEGSWSSGFFPESQQLLVPLGTTTMLCCSKALGGEEHRQRLEKEFCKRIKAICQQDRCESRTWVRQHDDCFKGCSEEAEEKGSSALPGTQRRGLTQDECGRQFASDRIHQQTKTYPASSNAIHRSEEEERGLASEDHAAPCRSVGPSRRFPASSSDTSRVKGFHAGAGLVLDELSKSNREFYLKYGILKYSVRGHVHPSRPPGHVMPIGELPFERSRKRPKGCSSSRPMRQNRHSDA